jgi:hypothetical protein
MAVVQWQLTMRFTAIKEFWTSLAGGTCHVPLRTSGTADTFSLWPFRFKLSVKHDKHRQMVIARAVRTHTRGLESWATPFVPLFVRLVAKFLQWCGQPCFFIRTQTTIGSMCFINVASTVNLLAFLVDGVFTNHSIFVLWKTCVSLWRHFSCLFATSNLLSFCFQPSAQTSL